MITRPTPIERLAEYAAVPSLSGAEAELADLIAGQLAAEGIVVHREGNNLWVELGAGRPRLLLNSHLDTVPPGQGWTADPWLPRRGEGRLTALGANDAKGCVAAMVESFLALHRQMVHDKRKFSGTLILALTAEEETAGTGLAAILDRLRPLDAAIVGEPTGLAPVIAQRGLMILRGVARGRAAHTANTPPQAAANAIVLAAENILRLQSFDWGPCHERLGRAHAHVTGIQGGIAHNVIPDVCEFRLDIRTTPLESHAALFSRLKAFLHSELTVHSDRLVPVETSSEELIVRVACSVSGRPPAGSATMSDMVFLSGIPAVKLGPGQSVRSHTPDEYILESELAEGVATYAEIVRRYFAAYQDETQRNHVP